MWIYDHLYVYAYEMVLKGSQSNSLKIWPNEQISEFCGEGNSWLAKNF